MQTTAPSESTVASPVENCPKCSRGRQAHEHACARCGLLVSRFAAHRHAQSAIDPAGLAALWGECVAAWDTAVLHDRYLDEARRLEALPLAARRYRKHLVDHPGDPVSVRRLGQIAFLSETIVRSEAKAFISPLTGRLMRFVGMTMAALFVATSTWVAALIIRH